MVGCAASLQGEIGMRGRLLALGLACLGATTAFADTTVTVTATSTECKVSTPDLVVSNSPSVAAGAAAMKNKNYALAMANFKPLAEKGDADGQRAYGEFLLTKCTGLTDAKAGADWLQKAADGGNVEAAARLGNAYMNGDGVDQDDSKAFALVTKAANAGHGGAQVNLGYLYLSGRGVTKDPYQGMVWTVKAGEQGLPAALVNIANAYFRGGPLPQDNDEAIRFVFLTMERSTGAQKARFAATTNNIIRAVSQSDAARYAERARHWSPGPGSLSDVLRDATRSRDQAAKATRAN
jgi:TPR repeat protein